MLAAAVASATSHIRVGTGGVMLPNHRPLVVAEQFGVDRHGLGRSVGFTEGIRRALGRGKEAASDFGAQVTQLLGYFSGEQQKYPGVHAIPAEGLRVPAFLLATGSGAALAAELGLPLVSANVRGERSMLDAIGGYRDNFRPSAISPAPYVVLSSAVAVAETTDKAWRLLVSEAWSTTYSRIRGEFPPLLAPEDVLALPMTDRERARFDSALAGQVFGTAGEVERTLGGLVDRAGADEILVTTSVFDHGERLDSYRRLAELAGIRPAQRA